MTFPSDAATCQSLCVTLTTAGRAVVRHTAQHSTAHTAFALALIRWLMNTMSNRPWRQDATLSATSQLPNQPHHTAQPHPINSHDACSAHRAPPGGDSSNHTSSNHIAPGAAAPTPTLLGSLPQDHNIVPAATASKCFSAECVRSSHIRLSNLPKHNHSLGKAGSAFTSTTLPMHRHERKKTPLPL
jgi:hypothetical protein